MSGHVSGYWVLKGHDVAWTDDVHVWGRMFDDFGARAVGQTTVGDVFVSTVFLGVDHNWSDKGRPLLFETMTFDHAEPSREAFDERCWRYSTWQEAEAGHAAIVAALEAGVTDLDSIAVGA